MTVAQVKEAIRKRTPIRIRLIFGEEIEYKRAIVVLPPHGNAKEPVVVLEDHSGRSVTYCGISQIVGGDPYEQPQAAY